MFASLIDAVGGRRRESSGLIAVGLASTVPTVAAGWADWSDSHEDQQRVGLVHAALNAAAVACFAAALLRRRAASPPRRPRHGAVAVPAPARRRCPGVRAAPRCPRLRRHGALQPLPAPARDAARGRHSVDAGRVSHHPRARHSARWGRSMPTVESLPWPG
ncbi:MAG TPA: hypothetical protein VGO16_16870 [Pseudonocardiaceae bacterium]|nr:hypothetical protein [Pseudonocardiaceae bacterium]